MFYSSVLFIGHVLSAGGISANPKSRKGEGLANPHNAKEVYSFLDLPTIIRGSFLILPGWPIVYMGW